MIESVHSLAPEPAPAASGIHPTAVIEPGARIHLSARIGPHAVIGSRVTIGPECVIGPCAVLEGEVYLGAGNQIGPHTVLGAPPQIRDPVGDFGPLVMGDGNIIREHATLHSARPGGVTRLGHRNLFMAYTHLAHDCLLGDHNELANGVQLAGHVVVGDHVGFGGLTALHQFVRVGSFSFVGAGAMVSQDVLPFTLVSGDRARTYGINRIGLRRQGFSLTSRQELAQAVRELLLAATLAEGVARVKDLFPGGAGEIETLLAFAQASQRGICCWIGRKMKHEPVKLEEE